MKSMTKSLILGLCMAVLMAAGALPAAARSTTGYASFHVWNASQSDYGCLLEKYGAVWNNCKSAVSLVFEMPIINTGSHSVTVLDYWDFPSGKTFGCQAFAYDGHGAYTVGSSGEVYFTSAGQTITLSLDVPGSEDAMQLLCGNIPPGTGIATVNWSD